MTLKQPRGDSVFYINGELAPFRAHPSRMALAGLRETWQEVLERGTEMPSRQQIAEQPLSRTLDGLRDRLASGTSFPDPENGHPLSIAQLHGALAWLRFEAAGGYYVRTTEALERMLMDTELDDSVLAKHFRPDDPCVYIEMGSHRVSPFLLWGPGGERYLLEGAYVGNAEIRPSTDEADRREFWSAGIAPGESTRVIDVVFTGSPLDKGHYLDDIVVPAKIPIQHEQEPAHSLAERVARYHCTTDEIYRLGNEPFGNEASSDEAQRIEHLVKVVLCLSTDPETRRIDPAPQDGPKLATQEIYTVVEVGPSNLDQVMTPSMSENVIWRWERGRMAISEHTQGPMVIWDKPHLGETPRGPVEKKPGS